LASSSGRWLHAHDVVRDVLVQATVPAGGHLHPGFRLLFIGTAAATNKRVAMVLREFALVPIAL
jgi:hypothetical protein